MKLKKSNLLAVAALTLGAPALQAASGTWDTDSGGNWTDVTKWAGDTAYAEGADSTATLGNVITSDSSIALTAPITIGNITAADTNRNYTITGSATNKLILDRTDSTKPTIDVVTGRTLTISTSKISGSDGLKKVGAGTLSLGFDTNDYSGGTEIFAGTVAVTKKNALGTGTVFFGDTTGSANVELNMSGTGTALSNDMTVNAGSSGTKTIANRSSNSVTYSGNITANDNLTILSANKDATILISGTASTIASGKTVAFSITSSDTTVKTLTDSAIWGGDGGISYTSAGGVHKFAISGAKTYTGGAALNAMSGTGIVEVRTSSVFTGSTLTSGAFGTGTLSIGATKMRAGTTGDITIGNAVTFTANPTFTTVADEKSLIFSGNAALGATRTLTVETGSTVATAAVEFSGEISGTGFGITKAGSGRLVLSGTNTYTGNTTVNAGVLAVTGDSIADTGTLVIGGGTVDLTNTETVNKLLFGGVEQPVGDYSTTSVPAGATITTASFSGTGTLTVLPQAGSAYTLWAATNAPLTGTSPDADEDGDGVSNAVEFVLGGAISTNDLGKLPVPALSGGNMTFTFQRAVASIDPKTTVAIEISADLLTWNTPPSPYAVPDAATGPVNPGVAVVEDTSPGFDTVTLTVPKDAATKFARLNVTQLP